jgi:acyl-CoA thioester hydrolase
MRVDHAITCKYFTTMRGVCVGRIGVKSIRYELALFAIGQHKPSAYGHFTHVYVDRDRRRSVSLTPEQRHAMQDLLG